MSEQRPTPKRYADLTLIQLKTFADRGDVRAQHELDRRMGGPRSSAAPNTRPPPVPPLRSITAPPRGADSHGPQHPPPRHAAPRAAVPASPNHRPPGRELPTQPPPLVSVSTLPPPLPPLTGSQGRLTAESLLTEHLPPGQRLSPEMLARLSDIASRAPEPEEQPPLVLGGFMLLTGVILLLFGFSVTRGPTGTWFYVACGLMLMGCGWLYLKGRAVAWMAYALTCAIALVWSGYTASSWLEAVLNLLPFFVMAIFAFAPSTRERLE